jgi:hypothetical protein
MKIEDIILDCYRLAKYYGRHPDDFLTLPLSSIRRHMRWTSKLIEVTNPPEDENG